MVFGVILLFLITGIIIGVAKLFLNLKDISHNMSDLLCSADLEFLFFIFLDSLLMDPFPLFIIFSKLLCE